jgi:hypothetical protein
LTNNFDKLMQFTPINRIKEKGAPTQGKSSAQAYIAQHANAIAAGVPALAFGKRPGLSKPGAYRIVHSSLAARA